MPWLGSRTVPAPHPARPNTAPEAWSTPVRRRAHRSLRPGIKLRPRTPLVVGHAPAGPGKRLLADLQLHAGTLKHLLPSRFRRSSQSEVLHLQPNELNQDSPESSPDSRADPDILEARRHILPRSFPPRAARAPAAASMGVDVSTYNMLMDMQHRDITPEDYDMLTRLDSSVQPKTLSPRVLDKRAPTWCVPEASSSEEEMPLPPGAVCPPVPTGSSPDDADAVASSMSELSLSSRSRSLSSRLSGQQCSICMEDLSAGERVRKLPCGHIFHASCVDEWLTRRSNVCPDDGLPVLCAGM